MSTIPEISNTLKQKLPGFDYLPKIISANINTAIISKPIKNIELMLV
jgi:hypothetical protein